MIYWFWKASAGRDYRISRSQLSGQTRRRGENSVQQSRQRLRSMRVSLMIGRWHLWPIFCRISDFDCDLSGSGDLYGQCSERLSSRPSKEDLPLHRCDSDPAVIRLKNTRRQ